ncbi:hypothetical protein [Brevundimonas sp.]|uniref:hypothetical protein n=1 Tax=Brevundimonas sp. TaxID=1871086 RepID=UPI003BAD3ABB
MIEGKEVGVSDSWNDGHVWIYFNRGENPVLAQRFCDRLMRQIFDRWPGTLSIPVFSSGGLPLRENLMIGDQGYEIDPAKLAQYNRDPEVGPGAIRPSSCR